MRDRQAHMLSGEHYLRHSPVYGRSRPKQALAEGSMTFAENERPEENLPIGVRQNELQHHTSLRIRG